MRYKFVAFGLIVSPYVALLAVYCRMEPVVQYSCILIYAVLAAMVPLAYYRADADTFKKRAQRNWTAMSSLFLLTMISMILLNRIGGIILMLVGEFFLSFTFTCKAVEL